MKIIIIASLVILGIQSTVQGKETQINDVKSITTSLEK
jgi:hypothetical protein